MSPGTLGTVVEELADGRDLVEFADEEGRALSLAPLAADDVVVRS